METLTEENTGKTAVVDGLTIHYQEAGAGDVVFFLNSGPSFGPASTAWVNYEKNLPFLAQHFRCIAMDLVNFGRTGPITYNEPVHDVQARTLLALMDHLGVEKAHIVGNSVGGTTALDFALKHPNRVKKLVIGACHASTGGDPYLLANHPQDLIRVGRKAFATPDAETFREYLEVNFYDPALATEALVEYLLRNFVDHPDHVEARRASVSTPHSNMADLPQITAPVLIIHGRHDRMVPLEQGLMMLNYLTNARLLVLNKCGSWPPYEHPDDYNHAVLNHLLNGS